VGAVLLYAAATMSARAEEAPAIDDEHTRCQVAATERSELIRAGVLDLLDKGVEWARTSAKPAQIEQVRRFIAVQERLMFGCPTGSTTAVRVGPLPPPPVRRPTPPPKATVTPPKQSDVPLPVPKKAVL
jgi:hypothetical protein